MIKTFDHYCDYKRTPNRLVLAPIQLGKWLVVFCDEINLPDMDKYGKLLVLVSLHAKNRSQNRHLLLQFCNRQHLKYSRVSFVLPTSLQEHDSSNIGQRHCFFCDLLDVDSKLLHYLSVNAQINVN